jgi:predicted nucleic acid-binding protein
MRLVDTSAWIEWLVKSDVGRRVADHLPPAEAWLIPTIVQLELVKWTSRAGDESGTAKALAFMTTCHVAVLDTEIAVAAADVCRSHRLSTADAVIYATAQVYRADLLTCDAHFAELPGVVYLRK